MHKILLNGLQISNTNTGVQYYTQRLYSELEKTKTDNLSIDLIKSKSNNLSFKYSRINRIFHENISIPKHLTNNNYCLYHSPNYVLPLFLKTPSILTIHDLITLDYPELCQSESVLYFRLLLSRSVNKAKKIIAISETVRNDILRHFKTPAAKIYVIYHGINKIFKKTIDITITQKYQLPKQYILFVGNIEPKKNLERLILAFHSLRGSSILKHKLVIVGKKGWKYKSVFKTIDKLGIKDEIIFTGYIPEEDLPIIYSMADLFVFPSLYEGFGFPPLEAMACEVPVLVSNKGALPEITGGKCPQVDPYNIREIAEGMFTLLTTKELRDKSIQQGKDWVKQFTWENTARKTLMLYNQVIESNETIN